MDEITKQNEMFMTLKEVAEIFGKDESTIRKIGKELFPDIFRNGVITYFNEIQITAIKFYLGKNSELPKTKLEKALLIRQAMQLQNEIIEEQQIEIDRMKPKELVYDKFMQAENSQPMFEVAKILKIGRNTLFKLLREKKVLNKNNIPYQEYAHYFEVIMEPIQKGSIIENEPVTLVKPEGIEYLNKILN